MYLRTTNYTNFSNYLLSMYLIRVIIVSNFSKFSPTG